MNQKTKSAYLSVIVLSLVFGFASLVAVAKNDNAKAQNNNGNQGKNPNAVVTDDSAQTTDTTTQEKGKKKNKGKVTAEEHRSTVANFVQSLLAVADREGGIGQQVKVIAQQQNDSKEKVAESIDKVEKRGKVKTFFFSSDYKNLGDLRSQMVQTRNQIDQLKRLADKAENDQDKAELQSQIQVLEQEQTNINNFITSNESKFSLFGWAVKLFQ